MFGTALKRVENTLMYMAAICAFFIMLLVSADAVARYFFSSALGFQFELTQYYLMVATSLVGISWAKRNHAFIHVTGIGALLGHRNRMRLHGVSNLLGGGVATAITIFSAQTVLNSYHDNDVLFGVIDWPIWLSQVWVPLGCSILSVRFLYDGAMLISGKSDLSLQTPDEEGLE